MLNFLPPNTPTLYSHISRHDYWTARRLNLRSDTDPDVPVQVEQGFAKFEPPHATREAGPETCNAVNDPGNNAYSNSSVVNYASSHPLLSGPPSGFGAHKSCIVNDCGSSQLKRPADGSPSRGSRLPKKRLDYQEIKMSPPQQDLERFSSASEIPTKRVFDLQTTTLTDSPKTPPSLGSSKAYISSDDNAVQRPLNPTGPVLTPDLQDVVNEALALYEILRGVECLSSCSDVSKPSDPTENLFNAKHSVNPVPWTPFLPK